MIILPEATNPTGPEDALPGNLFLSLFVLLVLMAISGGVSVIIIKSSKKE